MKPISKNLLKSELQIINRVRGEQGWTNTPGEILKCYIEEKKTWSKNNESWEVVASHLVIYDYYNDVKIGDKIIVDGVDYTIVSVNIFKPKNKYHHTELSVK